MLVSCPVFMAHPFYRSLPFSLSQLVTRHSPIVSVVNEGAEHPLKYPFSWISIQPKNVDSDVKSRSSSPRVFDFFG